MQSLKTYVDEWVRYEPLTGRFFWKKSSRRGHRQEGKETALTYSDGYWLIKLNRTLYRAHRIAFLIMEDYLPDVVDHIDRDRSNNKWENLRDVSQSVNCFNRNLDKRNKTGVTGVYYYAKENVYTVTYGKERLGRSKTLEGAIKLRKERENEENNLQRI